MVCFRAQFFRWFILRYTRLAESCFASFLLHGCAPDRPCITNVIDDGKDETTLVLRYGGQQKVVTITEENRTALAYGGWHGWVQFVEELPGVPVTESSWAV